MLRSLILAAVVLGLSACATRAVPPPRQPAPQPARPAPVTPQPTTPPTLQRAPLPSVPAIEGRSPQMAVEAGLRPGPTVASLNLAPTQAARGLATFRVSCSTVTRREDRTGLTRPSDWTSACAAARNWADSDSVTFFNSWFETVEVGDGNAFATGYYEPEIRGCRTRQPGCETPIYGVPADLLLADPRTGERGRGRVMPDGSYGPYFSRTEIEEGALAGRGLEIAWAADPVDLFFLQIQGSGRLRTPDGEVIRLGYAQQNGHAYVALGRLMRERNLLPPVQISLQTIQAWLRANPGEGQLLMRENPSYVFFRVLTGPGPLGSLGLPVTPRGTVAVDPVYVTYGAPVLLMRMSEPRADGLWVAQDTGGAIRGANRFDTFWGAGPEAEAIAGPMQARGRSLLLLPRGTLERLSRRDAATQP
ncbi:murein transglycosylase A [Sphingosinicella sp. YJ22]|uniref:murein transglycosylase A n=1 Tax=Sphingosinicella sp. YJ22 TaxID=1104780 RepID=UPI00140C3015|nr:murein transglycosylase A [Sphingosinicella sp. YJ22]